MKNTIMILILIIGFASCKNQEWNFPDFDYTAGYFPYQYPVRTLVLGDDIYDNSNDNKHKFLISAAFGGVYENRENREFDIEVADDLCRRVLFGVGKDTIHLLPPAYYTLSSKKIIIPPGEVNAGIEVQLKDEFFDDPLAIKLGYVLPVRIIGASGVDSVLQGKARSSVLNPDPRVATDWDILPKNFTMFAINYVNPYHGKYLYRGKSTTSDALGISKDSVYHPVYIERAPIWSLVTTGKNKVTVKDCSFRSRIIKGTTFDMVLTFLDNGDCTISQAEGSPFTITGKGKFKHDADEWGNEKRDAIFINYQLTSGTTTYSATDTLVIRDRAVKMELYTPAVF